MIAGIGTHIVEVDRMREVIKRWGEKFLRRVFSAREITYCFSMHDPYPHLSARFAAKEAAVKALSATDLDRRIHISDFEVGNEVSGRPYLILHKNVKDMIGDIVLHITLSHERNYALATVIAERLD